MPGEGSKETLMTGYIKRTGSRIVHAGVVLLAVMLGTVGLGHASELGHYAPALPRIRDFTMPPPGFHTVFYNLYYTSETLKDRNGDKVNAIQVGGQRISIDTDVDSYAAVPTFIYVTKWEV